MFSEDGLSVSTLPTQSVGFAGSSLSPGEARRHFTPLRVSTRCDRVHFLSWTNGKSEKRNALKKPKKRNKESRKCSEKNDSASCSIRKVAVTFWDKKYHYNHLPGFLPI